MTAEIELDLEREYARIMSIIQLPTAVKLMKKALTVEEKLDQFALKKLMKLILSNLDYFFAPSRRTAQALSKFQQMKLGEKRR